jgi:phosphohistidine phosphatase
MRLYLVQHGEANPEEVDPSRGLSAKGQADVQKVAEFLKPLNLSVQAVRHSGKKRAVQTADILAQSLISADGVVQHAGLAPMDPVDAIRREVESDATFDLMLVGHLPFMGKLASLLTADSETADVVAFRNGGVVCLERDDSGTWRVLWIVTPGLGKLSSSQSSRMLVS